MQRTNTKRTFERLDGAGRETAGRLGATGYCRLVTSGQVESESGWKACAAGIVATSFE